MQHFRQVGGRVFLFPVAVMAGTLIGAVVCVPILSEISLQEALAVGGGFGWYTFAPGLIMEAGLVTASAICFMHNVMREFISILIVPLVAKKIGYLEAMAVPACSSMDVCLPIIERSTRSDIAIYSFISGVVQSAAVPIVVPLILRLG
ncbi:lysine exporter LysO family protein [Anaerovoracaceae bacterium 41-7]